MREARWAVRGTFSFVLACLALQACRPKDGPVKIAVAVPLTGMVGLEGQGILRAVTLAVEQANASKRFPYTIEVAAFDDVAEPDKAIAVARRIAADDAIVAVIGHYNSDCAIPAAKVYAQAPVAMISPSATNVLMTQQQLSPDWKGVKAAFRVVASDDIQGSYAATFAYRDLGKRRIAVLHDDTPYGTGLAEQFRDRFVSLGGKVVSEDGITLGSKRFKTLLLGVKSLGAQALYYGGFAPEAGLIIKQARELGMKIPLLSGDGARTDALFDAAGAQADGAYLTVAGVPVEFLPSARKFIEDYRRRWTRPDQGLRPFDHFGFEAAEIAFDALEIDGKDARFDRTKLIETLRRTQHSGLLGVTAFDEKGDTLNRIITMTRARSKDRSFPIMQ